MKPLLNDSLFRTPQSFALLAPSHLLDKLRWDLRQLEQLRWHEELGSEWRKVVSYKAIECATTIWHLADWFSEDVEGEYQQERMSRFLGIYVPNSSVPITLANLRKAALELCPDLEICRVIAIASKHYDVRVRPRTDIRTEAYLSVARRSDEPFMRPVMWLAIIEGEVKRDVWDIFLNCLRFWEKLEYVVQPSSSWQEGVPIPREAHITLEVLPLPTTQFYRPSVIRRLMGRLTRLLMQ